MRAHDCPVVETSDFLLAALERATEAVVIVDHDLRVSHFNAAAERIWQLDRAEVLGGDVGRLGLENLEQHHLATQAPDQGNGDDAGPRCAEIGRSEIAIRRKDGSRIRAALSLSRVDVGRSKPLDRIRFRHHRRGRNARTAGTADLGRRPDQPRRCCHRSQSAGRLYQRRVYGHVRVFGVGLSLDDFGTGYSSLSRLAHLPIRELKIDRSFMRNVESDPGARAIVTTVVRVGQSFAAHRRRRASVMLRHVGRALSRPPAEPSSQISSTERFGWSMIRKSGHRFSLATNAERVCAEIMLKQEEDRAG
jgi:PAS domain S-box-containing protein